MKVGVLIVGSLIITKSFAVDLCHELEGAVLISQDRGNTYLGKITNRFDDKSIFNEYGNYGSKYADKSIWNDYSQFGGKYSEHSPFNKYSSSPPMIVKGREIIGYLSVNKRIAGAINPIILKAECE